MTTPSSATHMRRLGLVVLGCFVGAPLLAAPLAAGGDVLLRPLTINKGIHIVQASTSFGACPAPAVRCIRPKNSSATSEVRS